MIIVPFYYKTNILRLSEHSSTTQICIWVVNFSVMIVLDTLLIILFFSHLTMVCTNITTIEKFQLSIVKKKLKKNKKIIFPYNLDSCMENLKIVFGSSIFFCFLPIPGFFPLKHMEGIFFETRKDSLLNGYWPLFENKNAENVYENEILIKKKTLSITE